MNNNLFLVHGMGVHETDSWADEVKAKLNEVAQRYACFNNIDLDSRINYFPISYDQKLNELLTAWKEQADNMANFLNENKLENDLIDFILDWFANTNQKKKNFFWSHIADVLIYRFFTTYQAHIRSHVASQFVEKFNWCLENNPSSYSIVVSHSLGTSVTHDSLHMLGKSMFNDRPIFTPEDWMFQAHFTLANVSRIMKTDFDPYHSIIRPESAGGEAYFYEFLNSTHKYDPFTLVRRFNPTNWGDEFYNHELNHYHNWNIHGFDHYLDHPKVHIPLLRSLFSMDCITPSEEYVAIESYNNANKYGGDLSCIGDIKLIIQNELIPLVESLNLNMNIKELIPTLFKTYTIFDKIKETAKNCNE
jgi:hypothetical protein